MGKRDWRQIIRDFLRSSQTEVKSAPADSSAVTPPIEEKAPVKPLETVLMKKSEIQIRQGELIIPEHITAIAPQAMEGNQALVSVTIPGTVKSIGRRAFADCANLKQVILCEGIERIEPHAFANCRMLTSVVIPDSVKSMTGCAFYRSGLTEPVLNASRDTLYFCPAVAAGVAYHVPESVRSIGDSAFLELMNLKAVHLPETLERIGDNAFQRCGLQEITIPASVKEIHESPFWGCTGLVRIIQAGKKDSFQTAMDFFRLRGISVLRAAKVDLPTERYWQQADFQALARACGEGKPEAIDRMAWFFIEKQEKAPMCPFYGAAANFWNYRSWKYGNTDAQYRLERALEKAPGKQLESPYLTEQLKGSASGTALNALGFLFFDEERVYNLQGVDSFGVVTVYAYESEDGPDEDGFGRETYYDWWHLDSELSPVPGTSCLHSYSNIDRNSRSVGERFHENHVRVRRGVIVKRGRAFERQGALEDAFAAYSQAADRGDDVAMLLIGNLYLYKKFRGIKLPAFELNMLGPEASIAPDLQAAYAWFLKAAQAGNVMAMGNIGVMLYSGSGCPKDREQARQWLERAAQSGNARAMKAAKDFFQIDFAQPVPDGEYDEALTMFCDAARAADIPEARLLFEQLVLGSEAQLSRLGYMLALERYRSGGAFWSYDYPNLNQRRSSAPIVHFRCGWTTAILINLRAFSEKNPMFSFASDVGQSIVPVWGIRDVPGELQYEAGDFGWLNGPRRARLLKAETGFFNAHADEQLEYSGVNVAKLLANLQLTENEALFIENGEKEFSVEICHVLGVDARVLLRYTIGGWDQGQDCAQVTAVALKVD